MECISQVNITIVSKTSSFLELFHHIRNVILPIDNVLIRINGKVALSAITSGQAIGESELTKKYSHNRSNSALTALLRDYSLRRSRRVRLDRLVPAVGPRSGWTAGW